MIRQCAPLCTASAARLMLVDHDQVFVDRTSAGLAAEGFICRGFTSVEATLAAARVERPDMLLVGNSVTGAGGMELGRRIPQPDLANLPVIYLSAAQVADIVHRCDRGQGNYCVRKTLDLGVLVDLIDKLLALRACSAASN